MIHEDTQTNPMVASRKARRLITRDKVKFLIGDSSTGVGVAVGEIAQSEGVIYVNCNANGEALSEEKCHRHMFRVCASMTMLARGGGTWMAQNVGKNWYFLTHDYTAGHSAAEAMKKVLATQGGTLLGETLIPIGTTEFSTHILNIKRMKPAILIISVWGMDGINLHKQLAEFGVSNEWKIFQIPIDYPDAWALGPGVFRGYGVTDWYHYSKVPGAADFIKRYQKTFPVAPIPVPENNTYPGYVGMKSMLLAIEKAGTTDAQAVIRAFEGLRYNDPYNDCEVYVREWDHQFMIDYYLVRGKDPKEMKDRTDYFEVMAKIPGKDYAKTKEETLCKLESL
jgi:branched-chain amino acid transport system substrate-binding protein